MKPIIKMMTLVLFMLGPFSAAQASIVHVWKCNLFDGKTQTDVEKASSAWIATHKSMNGGDKIKVYHEYPLVATAESGSFNFVLIVPDVETWGAFVGSEHDAAASEADSAWDEIASCEGSTLWRSVRVE